MTPAIASARQTWIKTEFALGALALAGLFSLALLLWPPPLPDNPNSLLQRDIGTTDCPVLVGNRHVDIAEELAKPKPDFTDALLRGANLSSHTFTLTSFRNANLNGANISGSIFDEADLTCAHLLAATGSETTKFLVTKLEGAQLTGAMLAGASFSHSTLTAADLSEADLEGADFSRANLTGAIIGGTILKDARLRKANITLADYRPVDAPDAGAAETVEGISLVRLSRPDVAGLNRLANGFDAAGLNKKAREVRATASRWERYHALNGTPELSATEWTQTQASEIFFGWISADGSQPKRSFWLLTLSTLVFAAIYWAVLTRSKARTWLTYRITAAGSVDEDCPLPTTARRRIPAAVLFSLSNALLLAVPSFNLLNLAGRAINLPAPYKAKPPLRWIATGQALLTGVFLINWIVG